MIYQNNNLDWKQNLYYDQNSCWVFIPNDNSIRGKELSMQINQMKEPLLIMEWHLFIYNLI